MIGALLLAPIVLLGTLAEAHQGCGGHEIGKRNPYMVPGSPQFGKRQSTGYSATDMDPESECTGYSYPPVATALSQFPTIWQTAHIVPGDTEATDLFNTINAYVTQVLPNDGPRGSLNGNFSTFDLTYNHSDPDCWWTWRQCTKPTNPLVPADITELPEPMSYGLGFDDGPNCSHNAFYQYLTDQKLKATMFYIGSNVMDWPRQAQRGLADGHELAVHTWSHQYLTSMTNEEVFSEFYYTRKAIKLVTGVTPKVWRPPYGDVDNRVRLIASQLNLSAILWEEDSEDWRINTGVPPITAAQIDANYQATIDKAKNGTFATRGTIMLTHELNNFTMTEAIKWLPMLQQAFTGGLVPIASGMNWTTPYAETNVTYPSFGQVMGLSGADTSSSSSASASATGSMSSAGTASNTDAGASAMSTDTAKASGSTAAAAATTSKGAGERITASAGWVFALGAGLLGLFV